MTHVLPAPLEHTKWARHAGCVPTQDKLPLPELKADAKGKKEFQDYNTKLQFQRADLVERIEKNKAWIVSGGLNTILVV